MMNVNIDTRAAAAARRGTRRLELITILQQTEEFPFGLKNKTDQLVVIFLHAMNANIDNEEDRHHHQQASAVANHHRRCCELTTVLRQTEKFPFRYENKIDQLVETFLDDFNDGKEDMLCLNYLLPLYDAIKSPNIQGLQMTFEGGINYFPKKKGYTLLFRNKTNYNSTPFVQACMKFGEAQVKNMIEDTFIRCYSASDDTPVVDTLMTAAVDEKALMTAAVDENIHLDCVYFLLRRQPDILQKLLSSASTTTMVATATADMVVFNSNDIGISPKKRKRKDTNIVDDGSTF